MQANVEYYVIVRKVDDFVRAQRRLRTTDYEYFERTRSEEEAQRIFEMDRDDLNRTYDRVCMIADLLGTRVCNLMDWYRGCKRLRTRSARKTLLMYYIQSR